jgi:hypothetical protein
LHLRCRRGGARAPAAGAPAHELGQAVHNHVCAQDRGADKQRREGVVHLAARARADGVADEQHMPWPGGIRAPRRAEVARRPARGCGSGGCCVVAGPGRTCAVHACGAPPGPQHSTARWREVGDGAKPGSAGEPGAEAQTRPPPPLSCTSPPSWSYALAPIWTACAARAVVVQTAATDAVLLPVQAAVEEGRPAGRADAVVGRLAGVATALGGPVVPLYGVPRLAHVAVPEVAGAGSAAVQPDRWASAWRRRSNSTASGWLPSRSTARPSERPAPAS